MRRQNGIATMKRQRQKVTKMKFKDCIARDPKQFRHNLEIFSRHRKQSKKKRKQERKNRKGKK